jgi:hypothetical protein
MKLPLPLSLALLFSIPSCADPHAVEGPTRGTHAVMLSDLDADCTNIEGTIQCTRSSGAANVIHASGTTLATFTRIDESTLLFEGTTFTSERGLSPLVLTTPRVTVTATFGTNGYAIAGLTQPPFAGAGSMTVTAPSASPALTPITVSFPTSAPSFGSLEGLATEVALADGGFDAFFVYAHDASNHAGILREVPAAEMTLRGSNRVAPILPPAAIDALTQHGIVITGATVGAYREVVTTTLFPGLDAVPVQAGHLVDLPLSALTP